MGGRMGGWTGKACMLVSKFVGILVRTPNADFVPSPLQESRRRSEKTEIMRTQWLLTSGCALLAACGMVRSSGDASRQVEANGGFSAAADAPAGIVAGGAVLPNGRSVRPVGKAIPVGVFPLGMAMTPDGRWLAVLNDGKEGESVSMVNTASAEVVSTFPIKMAFVGIVFSQDGRRLWVAGGGDPNVIQLSVDPDTGALQPDRTIAVGGYPTGLSLSPDGSELLCTANYGNGAAIIDTATGQVTSTLRTGRMPYGAAWAAGGTQLWVTNWADGTIQAFSPAGKLLCTLPGGKLPGPLATSPDERFVYACAVNEDRMTVIDTRLVPPVGSATAPVAHPNPSIRSIALALRRGAQPGSVPGALAVNPKTGEVYVALSGLNAVAVVSPDGRHVRGLIPTGWYPTALAVTPDGQNLFVAAAKGLGSGPNDVTRRHVSVANGGIVYRVSLQGTGSAADTLPAWTRQVAQLNEVVGRSETGRTPLPPIHHVVYIVKENKTFDQVLGDLGKGDGHPDLTMYGKAITPNTHALASRFGLGDNFYSDGEVSLQGHEWTLAANSPDYVERTWPQIYAGHSRIDDTSTPVSYPGGGFLLDECVRHKVSCRMYGDEVTRDEGGKMLPALQSHVCTAFKGWNLHYPDTRREQAWEAEFRAGIFPAYSYLWLPDDHTAGTSPGYRTPQAMVATNDLAVGRVVQAISHSPYWKDTLIFVIEDDSQSGYDHIDAHRNILLMISPWVRQGALTHRHYSQVSISRTIEQLLGVPPLSQYDANAAPITDVFASKPDLRPFEALPETVNIEAMNTAKSVMRHLSMRLDLSEPDTDSKGLLPGILLADARAYAARQPSKSSRPNRSQR